MRSLLLTILAVLCVCISAVAQTPDLTQTQQLYRIVDGDTVRYTYTPFVVDSTLFCVV